MSSLLPLVQHFLLLVGLILLLTATLSTTNAFVLKSTGTGGWATGLAQTERGRSLMIVGTLYTDNFWGQSFEPSPSKNKYHGRCMVVQALTHVSDDEDNKITHSIQSPDGIEPQVCFGGGVIGRNDGGGGGGEIGVIVGTKGHESSLQMIENIGLIHGNMMGQTSIGLREVAKFTNRTFPAAITSDGPSKVFVALMSTNGLQYVRQDNPIADLEDLITYQRLLTEPQEPPLTHSYMEVVRYDYIANTVVFSKSFPVKGGTNTVISSLAAVSDDTLIVAGSTNDFSNHFFGLSDPDEEENDTDWDGYVMFLNALNGEVVDEIKIASQPGKNDFVSCVCSFERYLYIVGHTEGYISDTHQFDGGAFVIKLDWMTREFQYQKTISGMNSAPKCVASSDGLYVGFHVTQLGNHGSAMMEGAIISQDVVISKFPTNDDVSGTGRWSQWIDTTDSSSDIIREDYVVGMEVLEDSGNVAVLLNSANFDQGLNDIYVVELDKDTGSNEFNPNSGFDDNNQQQSTDPTTTDQSRPQNSINNDNASDPDKNATIWLAATIPVFLMISVSLYHLYSNRSGIEEQGIANQEEEDDVNGGGLPLDSEQQQQQQQQPEPTFT